MVGPVLVWLVLGSLSARQPGTWTSHKSADGLTFAVPASAKPIDLGRPEDSNGERTETQAYIDGTTTFLATFTTKKPDASDKATPDQALADFFAGFASHVEPFVVRQQRDLLLQGWPGLEDLVVSRGKSAVWSRIYLVGTTSACLVCGYPATGGRPDSAEKFLQSLVIPKASIGPATKAGPTFAPFTPEGAGFTVGMPHTAKVEELPSGGTILHRYTARYGNRSYSASYMALPPEFSKLSGAQQTSALTVLLDHAVTGLDAKPVGTPKSVVHDGLSFLGVDCRTDDGIAGRVEAAMHGGKGYALVAVYPLGHSGAPDLTEFFASFQLAK